MKSLKISKSLSFIALAALVSSSVAMAAPSSPPPSPNLPDANFNSVNINNSTGTGLSSITTSPGTYGIYAETNNAFYPSIMGISGKISGVYSNSDAIVGYAGGTGLGVYGESLKGTGVWGQSSSTTVGSSYGVYGTQSAVGGTGVAGQGQLRGVYGTATGGNNVEGIKGAVSATNSTGVYGQNTGTGNGVKGDSNTGNGVLGWTKSGIAVKGYTDASSATGIAGEFSYNGVLSKVNLGTLNYPVEAIGSSTAISASASNPGGGGTSTIRAIHTNGGQAILGVSGASYPPTSPGWTAIYGYGTSGVGVRGDGAIGMEAVGSNTALNAISTGSNGVYSTMTNGNGNAVVGDASTGTGVRGQTTTGNGVDGYATSGIGVKASATTGTGIMTSASNAGGFPLFSFGGAGSVFSQNVGATINAITLAGPIYALDTAGLSRMGNVNMKTASMNLSSSASGNTGLNLNVDKPGYGVFTSLNDLTSTRAYFAQNYGNVVGQNSNNMGFSAQMDLGNNNIGFNSVAVSGNVNTGINVVNGVNSLNSLGGLFTNNILGGGYTQVRISNKVNAGEFERNGYSTAYLANSNNAGEFVRTGINSINLAGSTYVIDASGLSNFYSSATGTGATINAIVSPLTNGNGINSIVGNAGSYGIFVNNTAGGPAIYAPNGGVGIGATPGGYKLYVAGNAWTTGTWGSSDGRLKTNVEPIKDALSKVLKLEGIYYNWKTDPDKNKQIGFIAQKVKEVIPEVVAEDGHGYLGIEYPNLTALLANSIKELNSIVVNWGAEIDKLKMENQKLQLKVDELNNRTEQLEKEIEKIKSSL